MISQLEKEITFRFLRARKNDGFLNIISIFSFIGIGLGVAVLIVVMSVMNGFRTELINKIIGFNAHITVKPYEERISNKKLDDQNLKTISQNLIFSNSGEGIIIKKDMIDVMSSGSVIYDLAAIQGGNSELTKVNEIIDYNGVKIMGDSNILNKLPNSASNLYAKNMFNFVSNLYDKENKKININLEDEIIEKTQIK